MRRVKFWARDPKPPKMNPLTILTMTMPWGLRREPPEQVTVIPTTTYKQSEELKARGMECEWIKRVMWIPYSNPQIHLMWQSRAWIPSPHKWANGKNRYPRHPRPNPWTTPTLTIEIPNHPIKILTLPEVTDILLDLGRSPTIQEFIKEAMS